MNKEIDYQHYLSFIREIYPLSAFLKSEGGLVKKLFF